MTYEDIMDRTEGVHTSFNTRYIQVNTNLGGVPMFTQIMGEFSVNEASFGINLDENMVERVGYLTYMEIPLVAITEFTMISMDNGKRYISIKVG